ncbi:MAG: HypC/HybG/HupF family hydrogenase formation chaperone [Acidimicrobiales bacterium]
MSVRSDERGEMVGRWPEDLAAASFTLARRFAAGATLWCWSPAWPQHAEHVAVEFVHPVIMGKRALPAAAVADPDPVSALRTLVSAGDVILAVAGAGEADVEAVMRRAAAWGATTIWVGAGARPPAGLADHLLWFDDDRGDLAFRGAFVLVYHVLWELTHVCFEHPGLLKSEDAECVGEHCVTCSDEATVAEVVTAAGHSTSVVRTAAGMADIDTTLVDPVEPGDLVLVHAGVAISRLDPEPA